MGNNGSEKENTPCRVDQNNKIQSGRGLGIQATRGKSIALLAKLNWRMFQEKEFLREKVILNKYCVASRRRSQDPNKLPSSPNCKQSSLDLQPILMALGRELEMGKELKCGNIGG